MRVIEATSQDPFDGLRLTPLSPRPFEAAAARVFGIIIISIPINCMRFSISIIIISLHIVNSIIDNMIIIIISSIVMVIVWGGDARGHMSGRRTSGVGGSNRSDDQISMEILISGKAPCWLQ